MVYAVWSIILSMPYKLRPFRLHQPLTCTSITRARNVATKNSYYIKNVTLRNRRCKQKNGRCAKKSLESNVVSSSYFNARHVAQLRRLRILPGRSVKKIAIFSLYLY